MNPSQLDQLRDTLHRESQQIQPVGLGAETVQHRGRRRRNRGRTVAAVCTATCVAGIGVTVLNRQGGTPHSVAVARSAGAGTAPTLEFRTVNGTLAYAMSHFTSPDGVTYALSTAPSVGGQPNGAGHPGQAIYRTTDGEHWTSADQGQPWITDLTQHDGVLYAIGTAPGAASAADITYHVGTSHDGGQHWADSDIPFDLSVPHANVAMSPSSSVQIARGPASTVALLSEQFSPNLDALIAAKAPGHPNATPRVTSDGFDVVDLSSCGSDKQQLANVDPIAARKGAFEQTCSDPPALGHITWAELGLSGPGDLTRQQILVSTDGTHWNAGSAPANGYVRDLVANADGFLLLTQSETDPNGKVPAPHDDLLRSTDARQWTPVATPAGVNVQAIDGNRVVGTDDSGAIQTSTDGGTTWNTTGAGSLLPAGSPNPTVVATDVGPLGFAVVAAADANPNDLNQGHDYLLFSADGVTWSTSDLAAAGQPANSYPTAVTVGADHVGVDYQTQGATPGGPMKTTTLLGTPKR